MKVNAIVLDVLGDEGDTAGLYDFLVDHCGWQVSPSMHTGPTTCMCSKMQSILPSFFASVISLSPPHTPLPRRRRPLSGTLLRCFADLRLRQYDAHRFQAGLQV